MEMRCVLPYQGRSERSLSSYQTGQDCPPYQMDSLIAAVSGEDRKKTSDLRIIAYQFIPQ